MVQQKSGNPKRVIPKQQIELIQILEEKPYGQSGKALLPVMAKNLSLLEGDPLVNKPLKYTVFNDSLKEFIKKQQAGARFLTDLEEVERPGSQYGPDRNIVQIYLNGEPVSKPSQRGGFRGISPEEIDMNYRTAALNGVSLLGASGKINQMSEFKLWFDQLYALVKGSPLPVVNAGGPGPVATPRPTKATENMPNNMPTQPQNIPVKTQADQDFDKLGRTEAEKHSSNQDIVKQIYDEVSAHKKLSSIKGVESWLSGVFKLDMTRLETEPRQVLEEIKGHFENKELAKTR